MFYSFFLFLLLVCSNPSYTKTNSFPVGLKAPYFIIMTTFGGVSAVGGGAPKSYTLPTAWITLEGRLPVTHPKVYLYTQFRIALPLDTPDFPFSEILPAINMSNIRIGALFGIGGIVGDWRNKDLTGWHITVNTGLIIEGGVHSYYMAHISSYSSKFLNIGWEVNTRIFHNIKPYFGMSLGAQFSYLNGISSGDSFYLGIQQLIVSYHMLSYGFSIGIHF